MVDRDEELESLSSEDAHFGQQRSEMRLEKESMVLASIGAIFAQGTCLGSYTEGFFA